MLLSIHYLRGLASLFVVMYHYRRTLNDVYAQRDLGDIIFNGAFFGVDLFFMISGFVIVLSTKNDNSLVSFYSKRIFKLYPVYMVTLGIWILTKHSFTIELNTIIKSVFLVHADYTKPAPWFGYSAIDTAWTLTYEIMFYFIFSLSLIFSHKYRTIISCLAISALFCIINMYYNGNMSFNSHLSIGNNETPGIIKVLGSPLMLEFIYGMLICEFFIKIRCLASLEILRKISLPLLLLSSVYFMLSVFRGDIPHGPLSIGIPCFILLSAFVLHEACYSFKKYKTLIFLGNISYPLYLIHLVISGYMYDIRLLFPYYAELHGFSRLIFLLSVSIIVSYILHVLIEKPASDFARFFLNNMKLRTA